MTTLATFVSFLHPALPIAIMVLGVVQLWRGLHGERGGEGGLMRRHTTLIGRLEGARLVLLAVVLIGLGLGWLWESRLLIFFALGFGVVELRESSTIINAFRFRPRPNAVAPRQPRSPATT